MPSHLLGTSSCGRPNLGIKWDVFEFLRLFHIETDDQWQVSITHGFPCRFNDCICIFVFHILCVFKLETVNSCKFMIDAMLLWKINSYNSLINLHKGQYQTIPTLISWGQVGFLLQPTQNHKMHLWLARLEYVRIIPIPIAWPSWPPPSHIYMLLAQVAPSNL